MTVRSLAEVEPTPADLASYVIDPECARQALKIEPGLLESIADQGFPHRQTPDGTPLFDYTDLTNVALVGGQGRSIPELARRFLLRFIDGPLAAAVEPRDWIVSTNPGGSAANDGGPVPDVRIALPDAEAPGVELLWLETFGEQEGTAGYSASVRLWGEIDDLSAPALRAIYDETVNALDEGTIRYQNVAEELRDDHCRAWGLGVADCCVASRVAAARVRELGYRGRVRRGFLLGLLGSDHTWCEVWEEERWKVLDPAFGHLARERGAEEFARACRGSRFNRLLPCRTRDGRAIIRRPDGSPAPLSEFAAVTTRPAEAAR